MYREDVLVSEIHTFPLSVPKYLELVGGPSAIANLGRFLPRIAAKASTSGSIISWSVSTFKIRLIGTILLLRGIICTLLIFER